MARRSRLVRRMAKRGLKSLGRRALRFIPGIGQASEAIGLGKDILGRGGRGRAHGRRRRALITRKDLQTVKRVFKVVSSITTGRRPKFGVKMRRK